MNENMSEKHKGTGIFTSARMEFLEYICMGYNESLIFEIADCMVKRRL